MKKIRLTLALALVAMLAAFACAEIAECPQVETGIADIQKYGNIVMDISPEALLGLGYEYGDVVTLQIGDKVWDAPICGDFGDVDSGEYICRLKQSDNPADNVVLLAISGGDLATRLGIAARETIDENPGFRWDYAEGYRNGVPVTLSLKEKGGYLEQMKLHQLEMSNDRADYPDLTNEQYANFRNVATTGMGAYVLYRSSSPVNPEYNRNNEADAAVNAAGICTVLNLADNAMVMEGFEGYAETYYSKLDVIPLDLVVDFESEDFEEGLAKGFRYIIDREGPYLVHCTMGKDRAGFASAVLECLMGASYDEVIADYMVSYYNFYGVEPGSETYDAVVNSNIRKQLNAAFGVEDIADADLAACAEAYLFKIGMTEDEIESLKARLGTDIA